MCFLIHPSRPASPNLASRRELWRQVPDGDAEDTSRACTEPEHSGCKGGDYVLYWIQSSQRAEQNHALEYAVQQANDLDQRLLVVFGLTDDYPEANLRHYTFMLEGLKDVQEALEKRGIKMVVRKGSSERYVEKVERRICASG